MPQIRITTAPWIYAILALSLVFGALGVALMSAGEWGWEFWGTVLFMVLCSISLLVARFTKIENNDEFITIIDNLKKKEIPKTSIEKVSWEKGSGSFVKLANGTSVKLPITGRNEQGVVNSVRSWLNRP